MMGNFNKPTGTKSSKAGKALRILTILFAIFGPVAMIGTALTLTLHEGDWWFNLFAVYLAATVMIAGTLYLSLLTLLWEITRHIRNRTESDIDGTPFTKCTHRLFTGTSVAGIVTFIPFFMIFYDILNGGFAIFHFVCGGILVVLYLAVGIYTVVHRHSKTDSNM